MKSFLYQSELGAHMVENLLGNENFIDRLVRADKGLAGNMLNKITELIGSFKAMGDATSRAEYRRLKQAEWMYLYAVEKAGYKYVNGRIEEDDEEDVDSDEEIQYNRKKAKYISYNKVGMNVVFEIKSKLKKLYGDIDGIADDVAVDVGDKIYIVDSDCEKGKIGFGIKEIIRIKDRETRLLCVRENNNDLLSKGLISDELSESFRRENDSYSESDGRQPVRRDI